MTVHTSYMERTVPDASGITLEHETAAPGRGAAPASRPPLLQHHFYEITLVLRGSCEFFSAQGRMSLIPGDLLLLPPDRPHACCLQKGAQLCRCQFEPQIISGVLAASLQDMVYWNIPQASAAEKRMRELKAFEEDARAAGSPPLLHLSVSGLQGMIHLTHAELDYLYPILQSIAREQEERHFNFEQMKLFRLQELLVLIRRIQLSQFQLISREASWKEDMINTVLAEIDRDLSQDIDFEGIAHSQGITLSYFRTIFKEATGMPPTDYLNRVRILRALELLQTSDAPVAEIGRKVGIYDANYFSRLFKKVTGYPPRYFKSIPAKGKEE